MITVAASYFYQETPLQAAARLLAMGIRRLEFDGLALKGLSSAELRELGMRLRDTGATCGAVNAVGDLMPVRLGNLAAISVRERSSAVEHIKVCNALASVLNCKNIVCDLGTSTEDFLPLEKQNEQFATSLEEILSEGIFLILLNVPGRRWLAWNELPPDPSRVVERHVWPWRRWTDAEDLISEIARRFTNRVSWAFDCANEVVAHGSTKFQMNEAVLPYLAQRLERVYLANHPGEYNRVWHRSLLHRPLATGCFSSEDYADLFGILDDHEFSGDVCVKIVEKHPTELSLQANLDNLETCLSLAK